MKIKVGFGTKTIEGYRVGRNMKKTCRREGILRTVMKEERNRREKENAWATEKVKGREEKDI